MLKLSEEKLVVIVAALSQLTMQLIANMATVIIPEISVELGINSDIQLYINIVYLCALVASSIPLAKVISQYGVKKSVKISCYLLVISLILCGLGIDFYTLLLARLIQGICCASLGISIYMMLVEELEDEPLGTALGLVGSCGYIGLMLAPSITGFISHHMGWRMPFFVLIPLFIVQLILLHMIKNEWKTQKTPIDNIGSLIYMILIICFTIGITEFDSVLNFFFLLSMLLVPVFIKYEKGRDYPIVNVRLFRNVRMMIGTYAAMATYFVTTIAITILTYHLVFFSDMALDTVGMILLVTPLTMVFVSTIAGKLSGKMDPRLISGFAILIILVSMVMFACLKYLSLELIILACVIQGIGHGFFSSPNNKYVLTLPDEDDLADTSAILSTSKEFGKIISSGIYTLLFSYFLGEVVLGPKEFDISMAFTNHIMIVITEVMILSAAILLFYSYIKYERYENENILRMAYNMMPERLKKDVKEAWNIKDNAVESTLKLKDVFRLNTVAETAVSIKDTTVDAASNIKDTTVDVAKSTKDMTVNTAASIKDTTVDTATSIKDTSIDAASNLKDKIK